MITVRLNKKKWKYNYNIVVIQKTKSVKGNGFIQNLGIYTKKINHWKNKMIKVNLDFCFQWFMKGASYTKICSKIIVMYSVYLNSLLIGDTVIDDQWI